jgi:putative DNA primase/helicase
VERLLAISGEDKVTINPKNKKQMHVRLPTRIVIVSNELLKLPDASTALVERFILLQTRRSWLGKEDRTLEAGLREELPAVLNWALEGLARLNRNGKFTGLPGSEDAKRHMKGLASAVTAFVHECCTINDLLSAGSDDLYAAFKKWAEETGHRRKSRETFGRDLRAAVPSVRRVYSRTGNRRAYVYEGIALI